MNNPMQLLMTAMKTGGNPTMLIQQMAKTNPAMAQAERIIRGKTPAELQTIAVNMCRERGTNPETVLRQLGIR